MVLTKREDCNKARFLQNTLKKTPSSGKSQISTFSFFGVVGWREWELILSLSGSGRELEWGGDGRLFEAALDATRNISF